MTTMALTVMWSSSPLKASSEKSVRMSGAFFKHPQEIFKANLPGLVLDDFRVQAVHYEMVCGYVYEGDELPEDFVCPVCGVGADQFEKEED